MAVSDHPPTRLPPRRRTQAGSLRLAQPTPTQTPAVFYSHIKGPGLMTWSGNTDQSNYLSNLPNPPAFQMAFLLGPVSARRRFQIGVRSTEILTDSKDQPVTQKIRDLIKIFFKIFLVQINGLCACKISTDSVVFFQENGRVGMGIATISHLCRSSKSPPEAGEG